MDHATNPTDMTHQQILERLAQIDKAHYELTESITTASAEFQESTQTDDDASENESLEQKLAGIRAHIEALEHERADLHARLVQTPETT